MMIVPFFGSQVNHFDFASLLQPEKETKMEKNLDVVKALTRFYKNLEMLKKAHPKENSEKLIEGAILLTLLGL